MNIRHTHYNDQWGDFYVFFCVPPKGAGQLKFSVTYNTDEYPPPP